MAILSGWMRRDGGATRGLAAALSALLAAGPAWAAAPQSFVYQGTLRRNGTIYTGSATFVFRITNAAGSVAYWNSGSTTVVVTGGLFRYPLGITATGGDGGFPAIDWVNIEPYVEVTVDGTMLTPRDPIASVPYALANPPVADPTKVLKAGDTMTGQLTLFGSTLTVTGNAFSVGGSALVVTGGNVGIGTAGPGRKLHLLESNGVNATALRMTNAIAGTTGWEIAMPWSGAATGLSIYPDAASLPSVYINNSGNVGIGTTSPQAKLEVKPVASDNYALWVSSQDATALLRVDKSGDVLIGNPSIHDITTSPDLLVQGNLIVDGKLVQHQGSSSVFDTLGIGQAAASGELFRVGVGTMVVQTSGNVGIGTTSPADRLEVTGNLRISGSGAVKAGSSAGTIVGLVGTGVYFDTVDGGNANDYRIGGVSILRDDNSNNIVLNARVGGQHVLLNPSSGNVGIGTAVPATLLDVNGNAQFGSGVTKSTFSATGRLTFPTGYTPTVALEAATKGYVDSAAGGGWTDTGSVVQLVTPTDTIGSSGAGVTVSTHLIVSAGNVGIGTTGPGAKLHVSGGETLLDNNRYIQWKDLGGTIRNVIGFDTGNDLIINQTGFFDTAINPNGGNLGIGTAGPTYRLDVSGGGLIVRSSVTLAGISTAPDAVTGQGAIYYDTEDAKFKVSEGGAYVNLVNQASAGGWSDDGTVVRLTASGDNVVVQSTLTVQGNAFSVGTSTLVVTSGNVGIGTTGPGQKLDVVGNAQITPTGSSGFLIDPVSNEAVTKTRLFSSGAIVIQSNFATAGKIGVLVDKAGGAVTDTTIVMEINSEGNATAATPVLNVASGVTSLFRVQQNGNLGIGTTGPTARLHVSTTGVSGTTNVVQVTTGTAAGSDVLVVKGNGNVGIGTTGPGGRLDVVGSATVVPLIVSTGTAAGSEVFRINSSGSVGIGTTSPADKLYVQTSGDGGATFDVPSGNNAQLTFRSGGIDRSLIRGAIGGASGLAFFTGTTLTERFRIDSSGNVGIGTGSPSARLHVSSASAVAADTILQVSSGVATGQELLVVKGDGKVGIGTANPLQKLHVEGQCVTGDTLILARRATAVQPYFEEVPIVELKQGDMVMSLNEATGQVEPHRVNGLLYMGVKPVLRLKTASGRSIRTTGNHPYLTRKGWRKVIEIKVGEEIATPAASAIDILSVTNAEHQDAISQPVKYEPVGAYAVAIDLAWHADQLLGMLKRLWQGQVRLELLDDTALVRLWQAPELTLGAGGEIVSQSPKRRSMLLPEIRPDLRESTILARNSGAETSMPSSSSSKALASRNNPTALAFLSTSLTIPLRYLEGWARNRDTSTTSSRSNKEGVIISDYNRDLGRLQGRGSASVWDRVLAIEPLGREPVWDIEVEGTHNFIGNRIFAHNTYLSGNLGIGTTGPGGRLDVVGSGTVVPLIVSTGTVAGSEVFRINSSGNVGIGTTGPTEILTVNGTILTLGTGRIDPYAVQVRRCGGGACADIWSSNANTLSLAGTSVGTGTLLLNSAGGIVGVGVAGPVGLFQVGAGTMTVLSSGNVGIGTTGPGAPLEVLSAAQADQSLVQIWADKVEPGNYNLKLKETVSPSVIRWTFDQTNAGTAYSNVLTLDRGNLGIGTTNPNDRLDVVGDIDATGCVQVGDAGALGGTCVSDLRLKRNIQPLTGALGRLSALTPIRFEYTDPKYGVGPQEGLIAQEVERVYPDWVVTDEKGYKRVRYTLAIQMELIQALKEQRHKIAELEARLAKIDRR